MLGDSRIEGLMNWLFLDCFNTLIDEPDGLTDESGMAPIAHLPVAAGLYESEAAFVDAYLCWRRDAWHDSEYVEIQLCERLRSLFAAQHDELVRAMVECFESDYPKTLIATRGAVDALKQLRKRYRLAVVSNFLVADLLSELLDALGYAYCFEFVINSAELGYKKPHPGIYAHALAQAGADATDVVFIGDNLRNDVLVPSALGMHALWLNRRAEDVPSGVVSCLNWDVLLERLLGLRRVG